MNRSKAKNIGRKAWNRLKQFFPDFRNQRQLSPIYVRAGKTGRIPHQDSLTQNRSILQSIGFVAVVTESLTSKPVLLQVEAADSGEESEKR